MYACVCDYIYTYIHVSMHMGACSVWRLEINVRWLALSFYLTFWDRVFINLELIDWTKLAGQWALGIHWLLSPVTGVMWLLLHVCQTRFLMLYSRRSTKGAIPSVLSIHLLNSTRIADCLVHNLVQETWLRLYVYMHIKQSPHPLIKQLQRIPVVSDLVLFLALFKWLPLFFQISWVLLGGLWLWFCSAQLENKH